MTADSTTARNELFTINAGDTKLPPTGESIVSPTRHETEALRRIQVGLIDSALGITMPWVSGFHFTIDWEVTVAKLCVKNGQKFLFIGDSITDCGRRGTERPYGNGYVSLFIEMQRALYPELRPDYVNMGIGGNTVIDLKNRWEDDVIREQPDWLSVKIGINDVHRWLSGAQEMNPRDFRAHYDLILSAAREKTKARFLLIDPFFISTDRSGRGFRSQVLKALPEYVETVHDMAKKYKARLVRTHDVFQRHLQYVSPDVFCPEPVHPYRSGHLVIATEIMKAMTAE